MKRQGNGLMPADSIPDPETPNRKIQASHEFCWQFGVNSNDTSNFLQNRLKAGKFAFRLEQNREFPGTVTAQIGKHHQFIFIYQRITGLQR